MTTQTLAAPRPRWRLFAVVGAAALVVWGAFALNIANAARRTVEVDPLRSRAEQVASAAEVIADQAQQAQPAAPPPPIAFVTPLPGRVVNSPFGLRQLPWEEDGRLHKGVDIAAPTGAPILATAKGVVMRAGLDAGGYGRFIEVAHPNGVTSLYAHLGRTVGEMKPGTLVQAGQIVALVGDGGRSTGSHLHFEMRHRGKPMNPSYFMGKTFAEADDLPLAKAARVGRKVRLAQVSRWPDSVRKAADRGGKGRVRARVDLNV